MKRSLLVVIAGFVGACSTILGADFEDRPVRDGKKNTGGAQATGGSAGNGSGGTSGGGAGGSGGAGSSSGGTGGQGGSATGGTAGGAAGEAGATGGTEPTGGSAGSGTGGSAGSGTGGSAGGGDGGMGGEPEGGVVVVNEIKGQGDGDDYIEIYNRGPGAVALDGYGIADESNTFLIPSGTSLRAGGYLLLLLGRSDVVGEFMCFTPNRCFHASWGVAQDGEMVFLRDDTNAVIDSTEYPDQGGPNGLANGQTWGRLPNGSGTFGPTRLTPEADNRAP